MKWCRNFVWVNVPATHRSEPVSLNYTSFETKLLWYVKWEDLLTRRSAQGERSKRPFDPQFYTVHSFVGLIRGKWPLHWHRHLNGVPFNRPTMERHTRETEEWRGVENWIITTNFRLHVGVVYTLLRKSLLAWPLPSRLLGCLHLLLLCVMDPYHSIGTNAHDHFFPVLVCAITASGVPGGTFVSMNRFSILCGWLAQRQGWRVKRWIWPSEQARLTPDLTTRDLWRSRRWARERGNFCLIHPCGISRVLLHAVKSYDMGPSRFTSHPRGRCAADFYRP
jgi:hypothetical protein